MRKGGLRKLGIIVAMVLCYLIETGLPYLQIPINFPITIICAVYLVFMEITSIIENLSVLNPTIKEFFEKILNTIKGENINESK